MYAQPPCSATNTLANQQPVCSDQSISITDSSVPSTIGISKVPLTGIGAGNIHIFTTVGETNGDTFLALYDASDNLLVSNDDDINCGGCKQSTITYTPVSPISGLYLIVSKPSCGSIDFDTHIKINARNIWDEHPEVTPSTMIQCLGNSANFSYTLSGSYTPDNITNIWSSSNVAIATINSDTGYAEFVGSGNVKITLKARNSCIVENNYIIIDSSTSSISSH